MTVSHYLALNRILEMLYRARNTTNQEVHEATLIKARDELDKVIEEMRNQKKVVG